VERETRFGAVAGCTPTPLPLEELVAVEVDGKDDDAGRELNGDHFWKGG
jgi:hypothetical protein